MGLCRHELHNRFLAPTWAAEMRPSSRYPSVRLCHIGHLEKSKDMQPHSGDSQPDRKRTTLRETLRLKAPLLF